MIKNILSGSLLLLSSAVLSVQAASLCGSDGVSDDEYVNINQVTFATGTVPETVGTSADDCAGVFQGNPSSAKIVTSINDAWGGDWFLLVKDDGGTSELANTYDGIEYTLNNLNKGTTEGYWSLNWEDVSETAGGTGLPQTREMVVVLKGGTGGAWADYIFNEVEFTANATTTTGVGSGSWQMYFDQDISGFSVYLNKGGGPPNDTVPEPSTLFLGLLGLVGFGVSRRRQLLKIS